MILEILGFKILHYAQNEYPWQNATWKDAPEQHGFLRLGTIGAARFEPAV
jgi:hypothetical protein